MGNFYTKQTKETKKFVLRPKPVGAQICLLSRGERMLFYLPFNESRNSSEVCGRGDSLRLRQCGQDALLQARDHCGHLQCVPSVLHWPAEIRGYGRPRG